MAGALREQRAAGPTIRHGGASLGLSHPIGTTAPGLGQGTPQWTQWVDRRWPRLRGSGQERLGLLGPVGAQHAGQRWRRVSQSDQADTRGRGAWRRGWETLAPPN